MAAWRPSGPAAVTKFFIFDVAESFELSALRNLAESPARTRVASKPPTPSYVHYRHAPVSIDGRAIGATPGGELMELVIVLILVLELALFFAGVMRQLLHARKPEVVARRIYRSVPPVRSHRHDALLA